CSADAGTLRDGYRFDVW
nr:immunoglobulin heavy chain junction region [Macaca mulatta]MOV40152.1 immunoglobulin heavy chain junction region [Macaca mulatta]MOV40218.1 immunoglobulin heavy chain junction region [Macaca mulatta]MOV41963.1 immunoglobulin heavy chain junction region [Macaca mulatta]MOV42058.1 immunoglobulin heavy chain junction region [Macaca mulatta]